MKRDEKKMVWERNCRGETSGKKKFQVCDEETLVQAPFMGEVYGGKNCENKNPARTTNMPRNILKKKGSIYLVRSTCGTYIRVCTKQKDAPISLFLQRMRNFIQNGGKVFQLKLEF